MDSDTWKQQWAAFWSAPWLVGPLLLIVGSTVWWFRGTMFEREIAGLKAEISTLVRQLSLAADKAEIAGKAEDELKKQIETLEIAVENKADHAALVALTAKVETGFAKLASANNEVTSSLSMTLRANDAQDVANFTLNTAKLGALRDLDGLGALRRLDPEALDKIKDIGKPSMGKNIGTTLNIIPDDLKKRD
jgi:hypothetical protein